MKITEALRVEKGDIVAIVGAGGKSSLMFALAEALPKPVCLTTTTKIGYSEGFGAFNHLEFSNFINRGGEAFSDGVVTLVTNPTDTTRQKWLGLSLPEAENLIATCKQGGVTCIIEADGARCGSLKAPADWEPVIPDSTNLVVVLVGLSVIGKPLTDEYVFRPEIFSRLTDLNIGEPVLLEHVCRMLSHEKGGLKGVPEGGRAAVVFNQADLCPFKPEDNALVETYLREKFSAAITTSLRNDRENCGVIFR